MREGGRERERESVCVRERVCVSLDGVVDMFCVDKSVDGVVDMFCVEISVDGVADNILC